MNALYMWYERRGCDWV